MARAAERAQADCCEGLDALAKEAVQPQKEPEPAASSGLLVPAHQCHCSSKLSVQNPRGVPREASPLCLEDYLAVPLTLGQS